MITQLPELQSLKESLEDERCLYRNDGVEEQRISDESSILDGRIEEAMAFELATITIGG